MRLLRCLAKRQVILSVNHQQVPLIVRGTAVVGQLDFRGSWKRKPLPLLSVTLFAELSASDKRLAVGVRDLEHQPRAQRFLELRLQAIVVGDGIGS